MADGAAAADTGCWLENGGTEKQQERDRFYSTESPRVESIGKKRMT